MAFLPRRQDVLATGGSATATVTLWDAATGRHTGTLDSHAQPGPGSVPAPHDFVGWLAFSSDGRKLASSGSRAVFHIWDVATGARAGHRGEDRQGPSASPLSSDGERIVAADLFGSPVAGRGEGQAPRANHDATGSPSPESHAPKVTPAGGGGQTLRARDDTPGPASPKSRAPEVRPAAGEGPTLRIRDDVVTAPASPKSRAAPRY